MRWLPGSVLLVAALALLWLVAARDLRERILCPLCYLDLSVATKLLWGHFCASERRTWRDHCFPTACSVLRVV